MTFTTSEVFIDSSILIEYLKGTKLRLLNSLIGQPENISFINETVVSEFLLYFIAINGNAAPRTLKSSNKIASILATYPNYSILKRFAFLSNDHRIFSLVPYYMATYNLLPNDAIILATCKIHNITKLASHDSDFVVPCHEEGIELLSEE